MIESAKLTGSVDLDVSLVDKSSPSGLSSVGKMILEGPGPFSLDVPIDVGDLHFAAFQDLEKDGPSKPTRMRKQWFKWPALM